MRIGVVSDTHNNLKNIDKIISIFNKEKVGLVVHTGDIASANALEKFSSLACPLIGVYGNNDRLEKGLEEVAVRNGFLFKNPPLKITKMNRKIAIFHEPELIDDFLSKNKDQSVVLHGHTHRFRMEIIDDVLFYNPGESAGMQAGKNALGIINLKDLSNERIFF